MFLQLILNIKSLVRYYCNLLYKVRKLQLFLHQALGIILLTNLLTDLLGLFQEKGHRGGGTEIN